MGPTPAPVDAGPRIAAAGAMVAGVVALALG
jgi:hypothetical protein